MTDVGSVHEEPHSIHESIGIDMFNEASRTRATDRSEAVSGAKPENAILTDGDLHNAWLPGANLTGADLTVANLVGAERPARLAGAP